MLGLSLAATGLAAVAAWLMLGAADVGQPAREQGYTLQTLIVTAILVLVAVAASVAIWAVAESGNENVGVGSGGSVKCNEVEVFDQVKHAEGQSDNGSGYDGSAIGCIPVCFWTDSDLNTNMLDEAELRFIRTWSGTPPVGTAPSVGTAVVLAGRTSYFGPSETQPSIDDIVDGSRVEVNSNQTACVVK